ncbi:DUF3426 domain-containing protein [Bordetella avium]|uniref:DUF3426 domain-containing protein n=1 Tax=Bordetella avium TaxID=521 RepID=UPI000E0B0F28|nr:DUF3426 domain-containing protein [Bordetella avium]RIQ15491.1 DUF3426 domain-containing protein [Bordetella avium]RIQ56296.1 DUF3426 domain-containing protein [Bordetella avium]RIQ65084.1 DUF3426 domain-containing protein [Bordetella avium]RIQ65647.1 DUF3426 domain-containing protein [Bordetella avium]RIQ82836.1 DUF3426 domain-containing protein [Bordetella avium]
MSLVTRCPHCATAFKVVADQLRVRNGLVRCGVCNTVFDGRACLVTPGGPVNQAPVPVIEQALPEPAAPVSIPPPPPAPPLPAVLRGRDAMQRDQEDPEPRADEDARDEPPWEERQSLGSKDALPDRLGSHQDAAQRAADDGADRDVFSADGPWSFSAEPRINGPREPGLAGPAEPIEADAVPGERRTRFSSATDSGRTPPEFLDDDRARSRGLGRRLWLLACLLGLLALGLQLAYVYRSAIATSVPALRPVLELACKPLACSVAYTRRLERISIVSSSLRAPQGAALAEGRTSLVLNVVMRNRYDKPQPWPALVLELTDISDAVVARKVLLPQDYLDPAQARGPFGANEEVKLAVPIEVQGINVNGFQLEKFFP